MNTNFKFDEQKAIDLCKEYSNSPDLLEKLIEKLDKNLTILRQNITTSPWQNNSNKKMLCVPYSVTVFDYSFTFYGSHHDAEILQTNNMDWDWKLRHTVKKERTKINDSVLYSVLCCICSDISVLHCDPEDLGWNSDSIKDMAKWNEAREHARKLQQALKLTNDELYCLPQ